MERAYFVGIDLAAETFTVSVGAAPWQLVHAPTEFRNDPEGQGALRAWLQAHQLTPAVTVICMEATGVYGEELAYDLVAHGYRVAVEPPLKVKRAFEPSGPKTDAVDSRQIAEYACRFADELTFWQPRPESLEQIQVLLATREQLVAQKTAHQNALRALQHKVVKTPLAEQIHRTLIQQLKQEIHSLDHELRRLIDSDPPLRRTLTLLLTIPGVGLLMAAHLLLVCASSTEAPDPRALAAYIGIAPYPKQSGKTVRRRTRSRQYGPNIMRKLVRLAARSIATHTPAFRTYYQRKLAEGKLKVVAYNNVANKLLKIICAVLRTQTPYLPNYRSVRPVHFAT